jgi:hypothetical protein
MKKNLFIQRSFGTQKKIYRKFFSVVGLSLALLILFSVSGFSQTTLLQTGFDGYNGTTASIPAGFTITWNTSASFYITSGNYGVDTPSYKFGIDNATIITPVISGIPDSLSFWCKGQNTSDSSALEIFESVDGGATYFQSTILDTLPTTGTTITIPLNVYTTVVKFVYHKVAGNVAFDDMRIFNNQPDAVREIDKGAFSLFPNPSNGILNIHLNKISSSTKISVMNILGVEVKSFLVNDANVNRALDLSSLDDGIYLIKIKSGNIESIKRFLLKK